MENELEERRKEEIIEACSKLYEIKSFKEINIKNIGELTSISRTAIYNYFETKEEIFLELLKKEYVLWNKDLEAIRDKDKLNKYEFANLLSLSINKREKLLKLLAMNLYDIEENSRMSLLIDFKKEFKKSMNLIDECLMKFFKGMDKLKRENFIYSFFPFMYGIYPYTSVTSKQKEAMVKANIDYKYMAIYDLTYNALLKLLNWEEENENTSINK